MFRADERRGRGASIGSVGVEHSTDHGAEASTPVSLVENVSRPDQRVLAATLATLPEAAQSLTGPAVILLGLAPRQALRAATELKEAQA